VSLGSLRKGVCFDMIIRSQTQVVRSSRAILRTQQVSTWAHGTAGIVGTVAMLVACGPGPEPKSAQRDRISNEFDNCRNLERYDQGSESEIRDCWRAFLQQYSGRLTNAQEAYAVERINPPATEPPPIVDPDPEPPGPPPPPPRVCNPEGWSSCGRGFSPSGNSESDVIKLGQSCSDIVGLIPFSTVRSKSQDAAGDRDLFTIDMEKDKCYYFFAVGGRGIQELHATLYNPDNEKVARDSANDEWPAFRHCAAVTGTFRYSLSVMRGGGTYHYQVWQCP